MKSDETPIPPKLFLASTNPGKLREFGQAAEAQRIIVQALPGIGNLPPCIEDGSTFEANARKKALHYSALTAEAVFADDSGLCVDALRGAPGVHSARFSAPDATDKKNNQKLLAELARLPGAPRSAHYVCVIALAKRGRVLAITEGRADGEILDHPRGSGGFGYDPYFMFPPLGKTFAEISIDQKFTISHRGIAFRKLLDWVASNRSTL